MSTNGVSPLGGRDREHEIINPRFFDDGDFQNALIKVIVTDHDGLRKIAPLLTADDFKPSRGIPDGRPRWLIAERALEHWEKHHEPIGTLVRADALQYANALNLGSTQINELRAYLRMLKTLTITAPDAVTDKVIAYKGAILKKNAIDELADLASGGMLTDEKWESIMRRVLDMTTIAGVKTTDYLTTLDIRMARRIADLRRIRVPWTFIEPFDVLVRSVGPKQLGLILAPYKRGKSLMLIWLAIALALQRYNVLYITLEDPQNIVEDRMDSIITSVPVRSLIDRPNTLKRRFARYRSMVRTSIAIYDGTGGGVTTAVIENIIQTKRNEGFIPHAVIIDYDEEIVAPSKQKEKRFESDEVYRALRQVCSRHNLVGWTAAQTQRDTRHLKVLSGDRVAEDIGKARKVAMCVSMGKGDWSDNSIYLWVAAHKTDKQDVGCTIISDLARSLVYDRDATARAAKMHPGES